MGTDSFIASAAVEISVDLALHQLLLKLDAGFVLYFFVLYSSGDLLFGVAAILLQL